MTTLINLTPHTIALYDTASTVLAVFPPSGQVARCDMVSAPADPATIWASPVCRLAGEAWGEQAFRGDDPATVACPECGTPLTRREDGEEWWHPDATGAKVLVRVAVTRLTDLAGLPEAPCYWEGRESIAQHCPRCGVETSYRGLPAGGYVHPAAADTAYIVSAIVAAHPDAVGRADLLVPAEQVRDAAGRVVGCRSFSRPA